QSTRIVFFLLFLIPGIPKDILCYVAGVSPLRYPFFILASTLGRLPGIVASSLIGGAAAADRWGLLGITTGVVLVLFVLGLVFRPRLQAWLERVAGHHEPPKQS
ncbi:MAG TPA: VTT domain-containing protein, partial [Spirochaetia bacterium]